MYQLEHEYWNGDHAPSCFRLGYYESVEQAVEARERYVSLPGFIDHPEGFKIIKHILNIERCSRIWAVDLTFDDDFDDYIAVGIFESKDSAERYIDLYRAIRGSDVEKGTFFIEAHEIGKSEWKEGFITEYYHE